MTVSMASHGRPTPPVASSITPPWAPVPPSGTVVLVKQLQDGPSLAPMPKQRAEVAKTLEVRKQRAEVAKSLKVGKKPVVAEGERRLEPARALVPGNTKGTWHCISKYDSFKWLVSTFIKLKET